MVDLLKTVVVFLLEVDDAVVRAVGANKRVVNRLSPGNAHLNMQDGIAIETWSHLISEL